jgi:hypothetical protein
MTAWETRLAGNDLLWRLTSDASMWRDWHLYDAEPLSSFLSLARESDRADLILEFAKSWGPLGLCMHDQPFHHGAIWDLGQPPQFCTPRSVMVGQSEKWFAESLGAWCDLVLAVDAMFAVVRALKNDQRPPRAELRLVHQLDYGVGGRRDHFVEIAGKEAQPGRSRKEAWLIVANRLNDWLQGAPVRLFCESAADGALAGVDFGVDDRYGIFPVIATQLLSKLRDPAEGKGTKCSGCNLPFIQTRARPTGERVYCIACRRAGVPVRDAARDYRKRNQKNKRK